MPPGTPPGDSPESANSRISTTAKISLLFLLSPFCLSGETDTHPPHPGRTFWGVWDRKHAAFCRAFSNPSSFGTKLEVYHITFSHTVPWICQHTLWRCGWGIWAGWHFCSSVLLLFFLFYPLKFCYFSFTFFHLFQRIWGLDFPWSFFWEKVGGLWSRRIRHFRRSRRGVWSSCRDWRWGENWIWEIWWYYFIPYYVYNKIEFFHWS